jgi:hypothetical protein
MGTATGATKSADSPRNKGGSGDCGLHSRFLLMTRRAASTGQAAFVDIKPIGYYRIRQRTNRAWVWEQNGKLHQDYRQEII